MTDHDLVIELRLLRQAIEGLPKALVDAVLANLIEREADLLITAPGCPHPDDQRVPLGGGDWECGLCRHRHEFEPVGVPS